MTFRDSIVTKKLTIKDMSKIQMNQILYRKLHTQGHYASTTSAKMKVGNIIKVHQNERIPADLVLLYTTEKSGSVFIRTD
jgi:phospholipid-translocating ATPase